MRYVYCVYRVGWRLHSARAQGRGRTTSIKTVFASLPHRGPDFYGRGNHSLKTEKIGSSHKYVAFLVFVATWDAELAGKLLKLR